MSYFAKSSHYAGQISTLRTSKAEAISVILKYENSLEIENEIKMRFKGIQRQAQSQGRSAPRMPPFEYVGMYAGPTKPKPFQRKRANLSTRAQGKLPSLTTMRTLAVSSHQGSGRPVPGHESRRITLALENIHRGTQTFRLKSLQGVEGVPAAGATLVMDYEIIKLISNGMQVWEKKWDELDDYEVVDRMHHGDPNNGVKFFFPIPGTADQELEVFCVVDEVRLLMYAVEFFYNRKLEANGEPAKRQTTHGRRVLKMHTLTGEIDPPPAPKGDLTVRDVEGIVVRAGNAGSQSNNAMSMISSSSMQRRASTTKSKRSSMTKMFGSPQANQGPLAENPAAAAHWDQVCLHQGWLLKKGGMSKNWMKRYAVLYRTAQGHFLSYYSDYSESPLYSATAEERNIIDLSKTTFIRPVSNFPGGAPPHAFDVCTIEREWTLCPINHDDQQVWLQILTRVIDEDVAVVPDDHMNFVVKARQDPTRQLELDQYTTCMKVSAAGVSVATQQGSGTGEYTEKFFWCYTDFFKWSLIHHKNKMALQVSVFMSAEFDVKHRQEFLFRTRDAQRLASAIEFYIEKFMSIMHLWLEGEEEGPEQGASQGGGSAAAVEPAMNLDTNAADYEKEPDLIGDLLGDDDDVTPKGPGGSTDSLDLMAELSIGSPGAPPAASNAPVEASFDAPSTPQTPTVDLFGNLTSPEAEAAASAPPAPPTGGDGLLDLMSAGNDDFFASPPASPAVASLGPIGIDDQTKVHMSAWFKTLTVNTTGLLFENEFIQLFVQQDYRGSQARIDFMVKSKGQAMQNISAQIDSTEIGANALRSQMQAAQPVLEANGQFTVRLMVECMTPFSGTPSFNLKFSIATVSYAYMIPIPSIITKFVEPVQMSGADLMQRWDGMSAPTLEVMEIFKAKNPINTVNMPNLVAAATKMAVAQDLLQSNPNCIMAAGTLKTGTPQQGNPGAKITVGCLIKLEMNANAQAYKLTVRTAIPTVSQHVFTTIKKLLT